MSFAPVMPAVEIYDHAKCDDVSIPWLADKARRAVPFCLEARGTVEAVLPGLGEIEISLVDDETIGRVHGEFLDDPDPTDVITFLHGEILVSAETARREGPEHGKTTAEEILLYVVHGLLHLNGHTDLGEPERTEMHRIQEEILCIVLEENSSIT